MAHCARIEAQNAAMGDGTQTAKISGMARSLVRCLLAGGIFLGCGGNSFQGADPDGVAGAGVAGSPASGGASSTGGQGDAAGAPQLGGAPGIGGHTAGGTTSQGGGGATASAGSAAGGAGSGGSGRGGTGGQGSAGKGGMSAAGSDGLADPRCPAHAPVVATACTASNLACRYTYGSNCLCVQPLGTYFCQQVDPNCMFVPSSAGAGGVSSFAAPNPVPASAGNNSGAVAPIQNRLCTCSSGSWSCSIGL